MTIAYRQTLPAVLVFVVLLAACGCENNARAIERQQQYVFDVVRPMLRPMATNSRGVLKVRRFTIASQYETYELVYRRGDLLYESDFYHRYFAPPASLVAERTRQWLAASGIFSHVLDAFSGADFDYVLEGNVLALYGDYRRQDSPQAVLEIQFTLIDAHYTRDSVIIEKKFSALTVLSAQHAAQLVTGLNTCLADILTQLESDLAALTVPIE